MKVVFVDDSRIVLETFKRLLDDFIEKYDLECSFYSDSKEVKGLIESETLEYDVMFVDINMPDVDGYTLAGHAKSREKYKSLPVIAVTTEHSESAQKRGAEVGIENWLIKSISDDSLHASVEKILQRYGNNS